MMIRNKMLKIVGYFLVLPVIYAAAFEAPAQTNKRGDKAKFEAAAQMKKPSDKAKKTAVLGDKFFGQKDYQNAVAKYAEAIGDSPDYAYAHFWKGYAHFYLDQYPLAIEELNKALDGGFNPLQVYKLRWYMNFNEKNYDAALADVQKGLVLDPTNKDFTLGVGDIYHAQGKYQDSIEAYKKALLLDPNNGDVYYFLALSYSNLGDDAEKGSAALEAIKKNTKYVGESYNLAADSYLKDGKTDEAVKAYQRAINVKPGLANPYLKLADIYRTQNKMIEAVNVAKKGTQAIPDNGELYTVLGNLYGLMKNHNVEAITADQKAIDLLPKEFAARANLCRVYNDTNQLPQSLEACSEALKLDPDDGEANFYLARAYDYKIKNNPLATPYYKKAVEGLIKLTEQKPNSAENFNLLGNAQFTVGDIDKAIEAYKKSLEINPKYVKSIYNLGVMYLLKKDIPAARQQYDVLVKLDPESAGELKTKLDGK